jgi:amino acid adenylation domain-containing protein
VSPERDVFPVSFAQERLWFLDRLEPGSAFYNVPAASRLRGAVDVDALRFSLSEIVRRHEALRTTFTTDGNGEPVQVIHPPAPLDLRVVDRRQVPAAHREAEAERLADEEAQRPFDLERGPLIRCSLVHLAERDHLLLITLHHIVSDAWSLGVLFRELSVLYRARGERRASPLPELPIQYADFAAWQRGWLRGEALAAFLDWWRPRLAGAPAVLDLPTDRPRPPVQTFRGALLPLPFPPALHAGLAALGQGRGATLFMTLLAAWCALLHRYAGEEDLVVGSPIANRNRAEIERLIGFFVNTLVLRNDLSGDPPFAELLDRVAERTLDAYDHQDLPFEKLVAELRPERNLGHNPLFQVMFSLQNASALAQGMAQGAGGPGEPGAREAGTGTSKFDLALLTAEGEGLLRGGLEYNTDLFERVTIERMLGHFRALLDGAVRDPGTRLSDLPLLASGEGSQLLAEEDAADTPDNPDACVHGLVMAQAARTPQAVAALFRGEPLTYGALAARARRLAVRLRAAGVGPSVPVGLCAGRSLGMLAGVLAILEAGGACLPLDPEYPADRLALMLEDAAAPVLLTQTALAGRLPAGRARVLLLDHEEEGDDGGGGVEEPGASPVPPTPDDLAYVIYTSGSTGRPKGVAMPHRPLVNLIDWQRRTSGLAPGARTLQLASLSFDVSFQEIFSTWCAGGTLVAVPEETRRDVPRLLRLLARERVERLFLPPVALQQLAEGEGAAELPALREIITAGEQLAITPAVASFLARLEGCRLRNQYGPSETHVVTEHALAGSPEDWPALPPIGRPIAGARARLLDRHLRPVPAGVPGELYLGGVALARGYLGRPDLTAERFLPDPEGGAPGARLYRTGDVARLRPDGVLQFLGRADHQVKIRGFRVELAEVEAALERAPGVRRAVVAARQDVAGAPRRLVAYLLVADPAPELAVLRVFLRQALPEHMLPSAYVTLDALPLTASGKVNRRALPPPDDARPDVGSAFVAPRTDLEEDLARIWRGVLRVDRVGVTDDFFDLGGHSLLATQVLSRVRDAFGVEVPLRRMFEAPTIADLAAAIVSRRVEENDEDDIARLLAELEGISDSEAQEMLG